MKIAIESNDGITITSPFIQTRGYVVFDVDDTNIKGSEYRSTAKMLERGKVESKPIKRGEKTVLKDCSTVISRGMDRTHLQDLKKRGIDVFITFKTSAKDAAKVFLKENIISKARAY